jgi:hypothetical protein
LVIGEGQNPHLASGWQDRADVLSVAPAPLIA